MLRRVEVGDAGAGVLSLREWRYSAGSAVAILVVPKLRIWFVEEIVGILDGLSHGK